MPDNIIIRKVKASQISKRPEPRVDKILENQGGDTDEQRSVDTRGLITIRIPVDPYASRGDMPVELHHNGRDYVIERDKSCTLPLELYEVIANASRSEAKVPKLEINRGRGPRTGQNGAYLEDLPTEINERFKVIIEDDKPF